MPRRPLIGITTYARDGEPATFAVPCGYLDAVRRAGATPLVLPPGEPDPAHLLEIVDALVLAGGGDVHPQNYGGEPHETIYSVCEERDAFELTLVRAALGRHDRPLLCICRGMQVLNVACGGDLHAHIPETFGNEVGHRRPPRLASVHPAHVVPDSRLAGILGATEVSVCSWHHQAVRRVGDGLRAVASAADGVIEAVEHQSHPWCVGVQWHPEMQPDDVAQQRLFAALVASCDGR